MIGFTQDFVKRHELSLEIFMFYNIFFVKLVVLLFLSDLFASEFYGVAVGICFKLEYLTDDFQSF